MHEIMVWVRGVGAGARTVVSMLVVLGALAALPAEAAASVGAGDGSAVGCGGPIGASTGLLSPWSSPFVAGGACGASAGVRAARAAYGRLPLSFVPNRSQLAPGVRFVAQGAGYGLGFTAGGPVLALAGPARGHGAGRGGRAAPSGARAVLAMRWVGARRDPVMVGLGRLSGTVNSFIGRRRSGWHTGVATFSRVRYRAVWPGISVDFYGNQSQLEYDLRIAPGADPSRIRLGFAGARSVRVDRGGALVLALPGGAVRQRPPVAYQRFGADRRPVSSRFVLLGRGRVGLRLGAYDRSRELVVDPTLAYSTYLGGSNGERDLYGATSVAVDSAGNAYVSGTTFSTDFPTTPGALQTSSATSTAGTSSDVFVSKLNPAGSALVYSTYLGGSGLDTGAAIAVDSAGDAYLTGFAGYAPVGGTAFPTTAGAFQTSSNVAFTEPFVAKLNPAGSALLYSTFLDGNPPATVTPQGADGGTGIAVDASGNAYVVGDTPSTNFPTTPGVLQPNNASPSCNPLRMNCPAPLDAFVAKLNATGSGLIYSTYLGGTGTDLGGGIALGAGGVAYVTGTTDSTDFPVSPGAAQTSYGGGQYDTFVAKLNVGATALAYSSYLGGSNADVNGGIGVDPAGAAYVTGTTSSSDFPTTPGALQTSFGGGQDGFVTKVNPAGSALTYSTFLGGSAPDQGGGLALDSAGDAYVSGTTNSPGFPTTAGAPQSTYGGSGDAFVSELNPAGNSLLFSTFLGGSGTENGGGIALDTVGGIYLAGTAGPAFPTTPGAAQTSYGGGFTDAFAAKFAPPSAALSVSTAGAGSDATNAAGTVTSTPSGISCARAGGVDSTGACSQAYPLGTMVTLTAMPNGSSTASLSGACTAAAGAIGQAVSCQITVNQAQSVNATFTRQLASGFTLSVYTAGTSSDPATGTVISNPSGIQCARAGGVNTTGTCTHAYPPGTTVKLTATPDRAGTARLSGGCTTGTGAVGRPVSCQVAISQARSVTATFTRPSRRR